MIPDIRLDRPNEYVTGCVTDRTKEKPFINFVLLHVWTCLHLLQPFKEEWQNREKIEIYMATLSSTPYIVFPVLLFLLLLSIFFLSPINQNPDLRFHPSSSSTPNHSQTKHQTPEASSFLGNVSTHGVPSTSTTTGVGGLTNNFNLHPVLPLFFLDWFYCSFLVCLVGKDESFGENWRWSGKSTSGNTWSSSFKQLYFTKERKFHP